MTPRALALALLVATGCVPGAAERPADLTLDSATVEPAATNPSETEPSQDDEQATAAEPTPASASEIAEICRVYRDALRSRWDDQRTREAVRGLSLSTDVASGWQQQLTDGDADQALSASRAVVDAARLQDLSSTCEALASLVAVAESMQDAPHQE